MTRVTSIPRRRLLAAGGAALAATPARSVLAQAGYPKGPLKFIVPLAPGGVADVATRALGQELERSMGQPVIVENRPGGLFTISVQALMSAPADGHTLLYLFNSMGGVQVVHRKFDLTRQLIPVGQSTDTPIAVLVAGNSPYRTMKELIDFGRANPGKLSYSTLGPGSVEHLKSLQIERAAGFKANAVPYKSGPDMVKDLIGGQVDFTLTASTFAAMYGPKGMVRGLAVLDRRRLKDLPDIPTIAEAGLDITPLSFWGGYGVREGTPPEIVRRLHAELSRAAVQPAVLERLAPMNITAVTSGSPDAFRKLIEDDVAWMTAEAKGLQIASD